MYHSNMHSMSVCYLTFRNYHVFYYLLIGASEEEKDEFKLLLPEQYHYLKEVTLRESVFPNKAVLVSISVHDALDCLLDKSEMTERANGDFC